MKNPWAFGILILIIVGYLAWNNFELPLLGKTEKVKGKIYSIKDIPGVRGRGAAQGISFFYRYCQATMRDPVTLEIYLSTWRIVLTGCPAGLAYPQEG